MDNLLDLVKPINTYKDIIQATGLNYISLDASKQSTGLSIVHNQELRTTSFKCELNLPKTHPLYFYELSKAYASELEKHIPEDNYEAIFIEDIFMGSFVQSYQVLFAVAFGIGLYLDTTKSTFNNIVKVDNKTWKTKLKRLANRTDRSYEKDKIEINKSLTILGITEDLLGNKVFGKQDQLDSIGILLVGLSDTLKQTQKVSKIKKELLTLEQAKSTRRKAESILKEALDELGIAYLDTEGTLLVDKLPTDDELVELAKEKNKWYKLNIKNVGIYGIKQGFITQDQYAILLFKKA